MKEIEKATRLLFVRQRRTMNKKSMIFYSYNFHCNEMLLKRICPFQGLMNQAKHTVKLFVSTIFIIINTHFM